MSSFLNATLLLNTLIDRITKYILRKTGNSLVELSDSWQDALLSKTPRSSDYIRDLFNRCLTKDTLSRFIRTNQVDLVIDVGANRGNFASTIRQLGYSKDLICIEPNPDVFSTLEKTHKNARSTFLHNIAIGDTEGSLQLNITSQDVFASALTPNKKAIELFGEAPRITNTINVPQRPLHQLISDLEHAQNQQYCNIFLKTDTQGYDTQVVRSMSEYLKKVFLLFVEVPIINIYNNTDSFHNTIGFYQQLGFLPVHISAVSWTKENQLVEVDVLFLNQRSGT